LSPALSALLLKPHRHDRANEAHTFQSAIRNPQSAIDQSLLTSAAPDKGHWLERFIERSFGWFFRPFNRFFEWSSHKYSLGVGAIIRKSSAALIVYGGLIGLTYFGFKTVPTGFVPTQDKQYLVAF